MAGRTPTPYYKAILDALEQTGTLHKDIYRRIRDVCVATEAKKVSEIRKAVKIMTAKNLSTEATFDIIPAEIFHETMFRLLKMGQTDLMNDLIVWYIGFRGIRPKADYQGDNWEGIFNCFQRPRKSMSTAELNDYWAFVERTLKFVIPLFDKPGQKRPNDQELGVRNALGNGIVRLFETFLNLFHLLLERTLDQLAKPGAQKTKLTLPGLEKKWTAFKNAVLPGRGERTRLASVRLPSTQTSTTPSEGYFLDAFDPHDARRFEFDLYDRTEPIDLTEAQKLHLFDAIRVVDKRLDFFLREFGFKPLLNPQKGVKPKDRRKLIEIKLGTPRINNDDDLARFACALYKDQLKPKKGTPKNSREDAWRSVVELLGHYFATQTSHTSLNLAEVSPYVDHPFPRVITGGQLHDCGVYAVRLINVLFKLVACTSKGKENRLDLEVSFLILPFHVGLIVTPKNLPPLFMHNQLIVSPTAAQEKEFLDEWSANASPDDPDPAKPDEIRAKFLEDIAAQLFQRDVDLPLLRIPLAGVSTPPRKGQVDKAYQVQVVRNYDKLFSSKIEVDGSDIFNFDNEFLEAQSVENEWYNTHVLKLWNVTAHDLWHKTSKKNLLPRNPAVRKAYADRLLKAIQDVDKAYNTTVLAKKHEVSKQLQQGKSKILAPKPPRITLSSRLVNSFRELGPVSVVKTHEIDARLGGKVAVPTFANPSEHLTRVGE